MTLKKWLLRGAVAVTSVALLNSQNLHAAILYSENFEGFTLDAAIPSNAGNLGSGFVFAVPSTISGSGESKMVTRGPASTPGFGITASNVGWSGSKFGEFHDAETTTGIGNLTGALSTPIPGSTGSAYTFSLDFYEPAPPADGSTGIYTAGTSGNGIAIVTAKDTGTANGSRYANLVIGDGIAGDPTTANSEIIFSTTGATSTDISNRLTNLALDVKHSLMIVGNFNTGSTLNYIDFSGNPQTVGSNKFDVYIDGLQGADEVSYRSGAAVPGASTNLANFGILVTSNASTGVLYVDNILIRDDFVAIPEPSAFVLMSLGLVGLEFIRKRRHR